MKRAEVQAEIRKIAKDDPEKVFLTDHAKNRSPEKGKYPITKLEMLETLEKGRISEGPAPDIKLAGGEKFTCTYTCDGHVYTVAGVLIPGTKIVVITGYENKPLVRPKSHSRQDTE